MGKYEALVATAGFLGLISFSSLVQRVHSTHNTDSLPWTWISMNILAQILAFSYGVLNGAYGIFIPNSLFIMGLSYILYVKLFKKKKEEDPKKEETKKA
jgi:hypothetical protein